MEARLLADGRRAGAAELQAVPFWRVVVAVSITPGSCSAPETKYRIRRGEPDVDDVRAPVGGAVSNGLGERLRREAAVVADRDRGAHPLGERAADAVGDVIVEVLGHDAADIVRLEDPAEVALPTHVEANPTDRHGSPIRNDRHVGTTGGGAGAAA